MTQMAAGDTEKSTFTSATSSWSTLGSVIQYDLGKIVADGHFQGTGSSYALSQALRTAVTKLRADHEAEPSKIPVITGMLLDI